MIFSDITDESTPKEEKHFEIENDQPIIQTEDYKGLPPHEFTYRYTIDDKNDFKWVANLIIKPYVFSKKRRGRNGTWYWYCCDCRDQDCSTAAISKETLGPDGKPINELISADSNHVCNPCPSRHLKLLFRNQMNDIILQNPWMTAAELYEKTKQDICDLIDDENVKILFLDKIPTFANMWRNINYNRNLVHPKIVEKGSVKKCAMCDFESFSNDEFKTHIKNMHRGIKPHQCKTCGKFFGSKARLESHESSRHLKVKGQ